MKRRSLIKGAVVGAIIAPGLLPGPSAPAPVFSRVRPGDSKWPGKTRWAKLNQEVEGNLIEVQPLFKGCAMDGGSGACAEVRANISNPYYLGDQPAGTQVSGWLDAWSPAPSVYAIKARTTAHVIAAVNFARENNLRLVVKGTGHSYQGTSNAADSLMIWTRAMNAVSVHDAFVPKGCEGVVKPTRAVSAGAGAMWSDLYFAVSGQGGRYVQGGGCMDVGVAGLIQSGGFGSFSKRFGLAAASLLEAEVVTADGAVRVANLRTNPDLFWAIKGGGGGSWGVVTKLTLRTHELPEFFGRAFGSIRAQSSNAFKPLIARFLDFYADHLFNPHWGEQVTLGPDNTLELAMACQGLDGAAVKAVWQPFFDWVTGAPDLSLSARHGADVTLARHFWDIDGNGAMIPDRRPGAPAHHGWWRGDQDQVGVFLHGFESIWLPASLLQASERQRLAEALFSASRYEKVALHFNKGLAGAPADAIAAAGQTAINPAAINAFALALTANGEAPRYPGMARPPLDEVAVRKNARAVELAAAELRRVVPDAGSYVSESNFFNASWRNAFWGPNYPRLRAIKTKYDPGGLFFVHHGVGSEDWSPDGFARL